TRMGSTFATPGRISPVWSPVDFGRLTGAVCSLDKGQLLPVPEDPLWSEDDEEHERESDEDEDEHLRLLGGEERQDADVDERRQQVRQQRADDPEEDRAEDGAEDRRRTAEEERGPDVEGLRG